MQYNIIDKNKEYKQLFLNDNWRVLKIIIYIYLQFCLVRMFACVKKVLINVYILQFYLYIVRKLKFH